MDGDEGRYKWVVLLLACTGSLMAPLDSSIVSVTLPEMARDLQMDYAQVIWVPTAYLLTISILLLSFGRLSDLYGRKKLYLVGFGLFTLASISCSISQDGGQLIMSRVMQGVGGALMMSISPAIITSAFPGKERGKALGINAMFVYIGLSLGPPLGGLLAELYGWPSIFLVNVPIGIVVILAGAFIIKEDKAHRTGRFDILGAFLFSCALTSLLIALTYGGQWGWADARVLLLTAACISFAALFVRVEGMRGRQAMLDLQLFSKNRLFTAGNISALLNYTSFFGVSIIISFYLQRVLELSITTTGLILLVMPLTMAVAAPISGWASDRIGSRLLATGGMVLVAAALFSLSTLTTQSRTEEVIIGLVILGLGMGLFSSPNTSSVMGCVRSDQLGVASGTIATMRTVGQSLSLAVMGAVMALASSTMVVSTVFGDGVGEILDGDFVQGMRAAFLVSAFIAILGAIASSARPSEDCKVP